MLPRSPQATAPFALKHCRHCPFFKQQAHCHCCYWCLMHEQSTFPAQSHLVKDYVYWPSLFFWKCQTLHILQCWWWFTQRALWYAVCSAVKQKSPKLKVPSSKEAFLSNKSWRWIWPENFSFMSPLVLNWILITSRDLYRCKFPFVDHDTTVMRLYNLSWVLHTGTISGCTAVFSILLY